MARPAVRQTLFSLPEAPEPRNPVPVLAPFGGAHSESNPLLSTLDQSASDSPPTISAPDFPPKTSAIVQAIQVERHE